MLWVLVLLYCVYGGFVLCCIICLSCMTGCVSGFFIFFFFWYPFLTLFCCLVWYSSCFFLF